jgi:hypothetical protein
MLTIAAVGGTFTARRSQRESPTLPHSTITNAQKEDPAVNRAFRHFPAQTDAGRELEEMLNRNDESIDLALANWFVAADVPQFANLTQKAYFSELETMTTQVQKEMERRQEVARSKGKNPNDPPVRCAIFCGAMLKLGFAYREEFAQNDLTAVQMRNLYADADNILLVGLLRTMRGSCVSMPLVYLAIGQRLGLPVHLVHIGKHFFVRWQEPGYRINIETTAIDHVWVTDDDSVYVEEEGMKLEDVKGNDLQNLSNKEVIACLLFTRSCHLAMKADRDPVGSWGDLSRAFCLSPDDPAIARTYLALKPQNPTAYVSHQHQPETGQVERDSP